MEININISDPKEGKTYNYKLDESKSRALRGKKIGDNFKGDLIGFEGYEFEITGGSDHCGFPMRKDVDASGRKKVLLCGRTTGNKRTRKGMRVKRNVVGNTVYAKTAQINLKILKKGKAPLANEEEGKTEEQKEKTGDKPEEEKPQEKPKEEKTETKEQPETKAKETKTEEKKEEEPEKKPEGKENKEE
jgi:small subunit ribosomal protein S6e